jgi:hypothetical protein
MNVVNDLASAMVDIVMGTRVTRALAVTSGVVVFFAVATLDGARSAVRRRSRRDMTR